MIYLQNEEGQIEYEFDNDELKRSNNQPWTEKARGVVCGKIEEVGDDFLLSTEDYEGIELNASSLCELYYLLGCFIKSRERFCDPLDMLMMQKVGEL